jgi:hypothetical protein
MQSNTCRNIRSECAVNMSTSEIFISLIMAHDYLLCIFVSTVDLTCRDRDLLFHLAEMFYRILAHTT